MGHTNLALTLLGRSQWDEALEHARRALEAQPNYVPAMNVAGWALVCLQRPAEASEMLSEALRHAPHDAALHVDLAYALLEMQRTGEARQHALAALAQEPNNTRAIAALGHAALSEGRLVEAEGFLRRAESVDRNADATRHLRERWN